MKPYDCLSLLLVVVPLCEALNDLVILGDSFKTLSFKESC
jgi:hypothetical protein